MNSFSFTLTLTPYILYTLLGLFAGLALLAPRTANLLAILTIALILQSSL